MSWPEAIYRMWKLLVEFVVFMILVVPWVFGIALAEGFWLSFFAFCIPPYAWALSALQVMPYF